MSDLGQLMSALVIGLALGLATNHLLLALAPIFGVGLMWLWKEIWRFAF